MDKIEALLKECRRLLDKPDDEFTEQDRCRLTALIDQLKIMDKQLPPDYLTPENAWKRFLLRIEESRLLL